MKLSSALQQAKTTPISSLKVQVKASYGFKVVNGGKTLTTYQITEDGIDAVLRIFFIERVNLFLNAHYLISSIPTPQGMEGIRTGRLMGEPYIEASHAAVFTVIDPPEPPPPITTPPIMTQPIAPATAPKMPPPPYTADQLENYCLGLYFRTKAKALTKGDGTTDQQAHQIGVAMMKAVPLYWFGQDKQLP
jgi:hypothetical protein